MATERQAKAISAIYAIYRAALFSVYVGSITIMLWALEILPPGIWRVPVVLPAATAMGVAMWLHWKDVWRRASQPHSLVD